MNCLEILFAQQSEGYTVANVQLNEKPLPEPGTVYTHPISGEQWSLAGYAFQPPGLSRKGIYMVTLQPLLHNGSIAKGDQLLELLN
jgi:hypothetical protein